MLDLPNNPTVSGLATGATRHGPKGERPIQRGWRRLAIAAGATLLVTACAPSATTSSDLTEGVDEGVVAGLKDEGKITFVDNMNTESGLEAHLMASIVNSLGGEAEAVSSDPASNLAAMASDDDIVAMNFWRWQHEDAWQKHVIKEKSIKEIGTSNYTGEEGWYVPTYVIEGDPKRGIEPSCPGLPDWEALNDCADVFGTAKTGDKGQYMSGAESWAFAYGDGDRIKNLDLNYEMVFAGSEAALFAEFTRAYEQGKPWLGLMWRPNYMTMKYDVTRVEFPEYTDECWATTHACQWPETVIYQIGSANIESDHPTLWKILQNSGINDAQLKEMQALVVEEGMSIEEAAKAWMESNTEVWKAWL